MKKLLSELQCDELEDFRLAAKEQAKSAVEHFKEGFHFTRYEVPSKKPTSGEMS